MTVIATCAFEGSTDSADNVDRHLAHIHDAADAGAALVAFPECSLHGYPDRAARSSPSGLERVWRRAESVEDGAHSRAVVAAARRRAIHVVYGLSEATETPGVVYNTAVLAGPAGLIGRYRKVHLGATERAVWHAGDHWPVFSTDIGRIGLLICADKAWPESTRELALGGAELFVMPTAWAFGSAAEDGSRHWEEYYQLFDRVRAAENTRWFLSSNYVGALGDTTYGGSSQIVDPYGSVVATSGSLPGLIVADVDLRGGISAAERSWPGPGMLADRRVETYRRQRQLGGS